MEAFNNTRIKEELSALLFGRLYEVHLMTVVEMGTEKLDEMKEDFEKFIEESTTGTELFEKLDTYIADISAIHTLDNLDENGKFYLKILKYMHYIIDYHFSDEFTTDEVESIIDEFAATIEDISIADEELVDEIMSFLSEKINIEEGIE